MINSVISDYSDDVCTEPCLERIDFHCYTNLKSFKCIHRARYRCPATNDQCDICGDVRHVSKYRGKAKRKSKKTKEIKKRYKEYLFDAYETVNGKI
jgi:hypothetical protein